MGAEYFLIKPNPVYTDAPMPANLHSTLNTNDFYQDRPTEIPPRCVVELTHNPHVDFTDFVYRSIPLFSGRATDIIDLFMPSYIKKEIIFFDQKSAGDQMYRLLFLPRVHSAVPLFEQGEISVWQLEVDDALPMFYALHNNECKVVVRLDLLESLLRNGCRGFTASPIMVKRGGQNG